MPKMFSEVICDDCGENKTAILDSDLTVCIMDCVNSDKKCIFREIRNAKESNENRRTGSQVRGHPH
jgi:hypothetical protein